MAEVGEGIEGFQGYCCGHLHTGHSQVRLVWVYCWCALAEVEVQAISCFLLMLCGASRAYRMPCAAAVPHPVGAGAFRCALAPCCSCSEEHMHGRHQISMCFLRWLNCMKN